MNSTTSTFCSFQTAGRSDIFIGVVSVDWFPEKLSRLGDAQGRRRRGAGVISPNRLTEDCQNSDSSRDVTIEDGGPRTSTNSCEADRCQDASLIRTRKGPNSGVQD